MIFRSLVLLAFYLPIAQAPSQPAAQTAVPTANSQTAPGATTPAPKADCNGVPCDEQQQPHIIVTLPQPTPAPWLLHDRVDLAARLALALLGYVAILVALSTLKKIERNTRAAEETAQAALEIAQAALKSAQTVADAERPWLLISVEPSIEKVNSFTVIATNRGRRPASLVDSIDAIEFAADETSLPAVPEYKSVAQTAPPVPIILVPGESTPIKSIGRDEVEAICASAERFRQVQTWDQKIFLHGRILYRDLTASTGERPHTTNWCCWYIHGRQKSGLVIAGPAPYNAHT